MTINPTSCRICDRSMSYVFSKTILNKYSISYYHCEICNFIQTEEPYWLSESYSEAISSTDIGLLNRNLRLNTQLKDIIHKNFEYDKTAFLDWGGGYGVLVRIMRDSGFDFYRHDTYCENIFAKHFDLADITDKIRRFEAITAFEVIEHLGHNLMSELTKIFEMSSNLIFSTEIMPENIKDVENWWYLGLDTGQHISFFSHKSLNALALKFNKYYYTDGRSLHIFTSKQLFNPFNVSTSKKLIKFLTKKITPDIVIKDGLQIDYKFIIEKIYNS